MTGHTKLPWVRLHASGRLYVPGTMARGLGLAPGQHVAYTRLGEHRFELRVADAGLLVHAVDDTEHAVDIRVHGAMRDMGAELPTGSPVPVGFRDLGDVAGILVDLRPGLCSTW